MGRGTETRVGRDTGGKRRGRGPRARVGFTDALSSKGVGQSELGIEQVIGWAWDKFTGGRGEIA